MNEMERNVSLKKKIVDLGGVSPQDFDAMTKLAKMEAKMEGMQRDIAQLGESTGAIQVSVNDVRERVVRIETQLDHMPTRLAMWTAMGAAVLAVMSGLWWIVQQYLGPLLARAAGA